MSLFGKVVDILEKEYNIKSDEVVYVGNDMLNDIYCASQFGFKTVLFAGDVRSLRLRANDERIQNIKPSAIITELPQLVDLVKN